MLGTLVQRYLDGGLGSAAAWVVRQDAVQPGRQLASSQATGALGTRWRFGPPVASAPIFDLASVTKPFTAAIAMTLVADGKLGLDQQVRTYLPQFGNAATVGDLLGHRAGMVAHLPFYKTMWGPQQTSGAVTLRDAALAAPATAPNQATVYSDLGYIVLGHVLELAGQAPLAELLQTRIATPLGIATSYLPATQPNLAAQVVATELCAMRGLVCGAVHDENCFVGGGIAGHAGLFGTAADVATFGAAIIAAWHGEPTPCFTQAVVRQFLAPPPIATSWRMGWDTPSASPGVSHAGDRWPRSDGFGHLGFTGTSIWLDMASRTTSVLLTNRVHTSRVASAEPIKQLRREFGDAVQTLLALD